MLKLYLILTGLVYPMPCNPVERVTYLLATLFGLLLGVTIAELHCDHPAVVVLDIP